MRLLSEICVEELASFDDFKNTWKCDELSFFHDRKPVGRYYHIPYITNNVENIGKEFRIEFLLINLQSTW